MGYLEGDSSPSAVVIVTEDPDTLNINNPMSFAITSLKNENRHLKAEIIALRRIIDFGISGGTLADSDPSDPEIENDSSSTNNLYCIEDETAKKFEEVVHARATLLVDDLLAQAKTLQNGTAAVSTGRVGCLMTRWRLIALILLTAVVVGGLCASLFVSKADNTDNYFS